MMVDLQIDFTGVELAAKLGVHTDTIRDAFTRVSGLGDGGLQIKFSKNKTMRRELVIEILVELSRKKRGRTEEKRKKARAVAVELYGAAVLEHFKEEEVDSVEEKAKRLKRTIKAVEHVELKTKNSFAERRLGWEERVEDLRQRKKAAFDNAQPLKGLGEMRVVNTLSDIDAEVDLKLGQPALIQAERPGEKAEGKSSDVLEKLRKFTIFDVVNWMSLAYLIRGGFVQLGTDGVYLALMFSVFVLGVQSVAKKSGKVDTANWMVWVCVFLEALVSLIHYGTTVELYEGLKRAKDVIEVVDGVEVAKVFEGWQTWKVGVFTSILLFAMPIFALFGTLSMTKDEYWEEEEK